MLCCEPKGLVKYSYTQKSPRSLDTSGFFYGAGNRTRTDDIWLYVRENDMQKNVADKMKAIIENADKSDNVINFRHNKANKIRQGVKIIPAFVLSCGMMTMMPTKRGLK